jgi:hypothetical protein
MKAFKLGYDPAHEIADRIETAARRTMKATAPVGDAEFKEEEHPWRDDGKFGEGTGEKKGEEEYRKHTEMMKKAMRE